MDSILRFAKTAYLENHQLKPLLSDYKNPDDYISRMVKKGELIRLKNGFYLISEKIQNSPIPFEQIANLLYGPSYLSLEWALSYYHMIPEGVYVVTSVTVAQSRSFVTSVGTFEYTYLNHDRYSIGIDQKENEAGRFLIATPEKALADLIHMKSKNLSGKDLLEDLIESRRIERDVLKNLNKKALIEIRDQYRSKNIDNLVNVLGIL